MGIRSRAGLSSVPAAQTPWLAAPLQEQLWTWRVRSGRGHGQQVRLGCRGSRARSPSLPHSQPHFPEIITRARALPGSQRQMARVVRINGDPYLRKQTIPSELCGIPGPGAGSTARCLPANRLWINTVSCKMQSQPCTQSPSHFPVPGNAGTAVESGLAASGHFLLVVTVAAGLPHV